ALSATQGFHYAVGTSSDTLPSSGNATYTLLGATEVTRGDGTVAVGTATGDMTVAFAVTSTVGLSLTLNLDGTDYDITTTGGTATPASSEVTALSNHPTTFTGLPASPTTGVCSTPCTASVFGFFAGTNAERAGLAVHLFHGAGGSADSI